MPYSNKFLPKKNQLFCCQIACFHSFFTESEKMDRSEAINLHFVNFISQYRDLQRKKMYYVQQFLNSQMSVHVQYMQLIESCKKAIEYLEECNKLNVPQESLPSRVIRRGIWKIERRSNFWEKEVPKYTEEEFKQHFRMTRKSFEKLCKSLYFLKRHDTNQRKAIPLEKRIAIALYALGSTSEYRTIANLFGVGRTTTGEIVLEFCGAVCDTLEKEYINMYPPSAEKLNEIVAGFERLGFPQCVGAIDGCHIEIAPHKGEDVDFYNSMGWYSVILFASADYRCRFTYINVGAPGRNNDSVIFQNSSLKQSHETNPLFENCKIIENVEVPMLLIGDSSFQLSKYVMKPYPSCSNQSAEEKNYNYVLSKCRKVIENAFVHLKARFKKIGKGLEVRPANSSKIIKACCILHNFLIEENDNIWDCWLDELKETENSKPNVQPQYTTTVGENDEEGKAIREALTSFFSRERGLEQLEEDISCLNVLARGGVGVPGGVADDGDVGGGVGVAGGDVLKVIGGGDVGPAGDG